jgi:hypothetical protein
MNLTAYLNERFQFSYGVSNYAVLYSTLASAIWQFQIRPAVGSPIVNLYFMTGGSPQSAAATYDSTNKIVVFQCPSTLIKGLEAGTYYFDFGFTLPGYDFERVDGGTIVFTAGVTTPGVTGSPPAPIGSDDTVTGGADPTPSPVPITLTSAISAANSSALAAAASAETATAASEIATNDASAAHNDRLAADADASAAHNDRLAADADASAAHNDRLAADADASTTHAAAILIAGGPVYVGQRHDRGVVGVELTAQQGRGQRLRQPRLRRLGADRANSFQRLDRRRRDLGFRHGYSAKAHQDRDKSIFVGRRRAVR